MTREKMKTHGRGLGLTRMTLREARVTLIGTSRACSRVFTSSDLKAYLQRQCS